MNMPSEGENKRAGHRFVVYGDACSGVAGAQHERNLAAVSRVIQRLDPAPDFILFTGDEIVGLTPDPQHLRQQWRHFLDREMGWLDRAATPLYHATSNHATYDAMSEAVFRDVLAMPRNGPPGQEGLSYWVRRGDLLMVFVHTFWSGLGGEGHVETDWLRRTLRDHADARHKLVIGHHPVYPINGFSAPYQREIGPEHRETFWRILVGAGVLAYLCGHILAFDAQVHEGVLQICTAGAGTHHRMPEGIEYLHCVAATLDDEGLRYRVLDTEGRVRERLDWPLGQPTADAWRRLAIGEVAAPVVGRLAAGQGLWLRISGGTAAIGEGPAQTFMSAFASDLLAPVWLGLQGPQQRLTAIVGGRPGRSPHYWVGPTLDPDAPFTLELCLCPDMGPGGLLWRRAEGAPWSSLAPASATGVETLDWPERWSIGHGQRGESDRPFRGAALTVEIALA